MLDDVRRWDRDHPDLVRLRKAKWANKKYRADTVKMRMIGRKSMRSRRLNNPIDVATEAERFSAAHPHYQREWRRERNRFLESSGLCIQCGARPRGDKFKACDDCRRKTSERNNASNLAIRADVLSLYGGKCTCCGETEDHFLSLDHVNNDGGKLRKMKDPNHGGGLYRYALKEKRSDLQLNCHNCNFAKGRYGICPHEAKRRKDSAGDYRL